MMKGTPKFGMPMEEFKALLNKDERVPKLTDKRTVMKALQAKFEMAAKTVNCYGKEVLFQPDVFSQALDEAICE